MPSDILANTALSGLVSTPLGRLELAGILVTGLSVTAVGAAVIIDFFEAGQERKTRRERRSVVATGTMTAFFVVLYLCVRFGVGELAIPVSARAALIVAGIALMAAGAAVNIRGRIDLGKNWANHVKVYEDHALITTGAYRYVRHPLYASLIWMGFAAGLIFANWVAIAATLLVFTPAMAYRARQEEEALAKEFKEYKDYQRRTWMLFLRLWR